MCCELMKADDQHLKIHKINRPSTIRNEQKKENNVYEINNGKVIAPIFNAVNVSFDRSHKCISCS